jgi:AmmeMemoRadiSam system protein B
LANTVDEYIQGARLPALVGELVAVVSPHAGHRYSGPVAGYAFAALRGLKRDVVAVVSPMHYPAHAPVLTTAHDAYATPLGLVPVDRQVLHAVDTTLQRDAGIGITPVRRDPEHSLEIELPFLQRALAGEFRLVPIMVRDTSPTLMRLLGKALAQALVGRDALLIASSDLSHFYSQLVAQTLDSEMLHRIEAFDPEGILQAEEQGKGFACGRGALAAVLWAAKDLGADTVRILHYATSGDVTGDYDQVVGYGAAAILRAGASGS